MLCFINFLILILCYALLISFSLYFIIQYSYCYKQWRIQFFWRGLKKIFQHGIKRKNQFIYLI